VRSLPRRIPIYKLIWREHYAAESASQSPGVPSAEPQHFPPAATMPP
jgi:hypothetical protein